MSNYFFHIQPINVDSGLAISKDIVIYDYEKQLKEMEEYNKKGYNIYSSLNTFNSTRRRTSELATLNHILVDLDYKGVEKENFILLRKKIKQLENDFGIFPIEINETGRGYHLIYKLSKELEFLKNELYSEISEILNGYYIADTKAKQITGLKRVYNFIDHKSGFKILNRYKATKIKENKHLITIDTVKKFCNISDNDIFLKGNINNIRVKYKDGNIDFEDLQNKKKIRENKEIKKIEEKKRTKKVINDLIEEIDGLEIIKNLNKLYLENKVGFNKYINVDENGNIDNTSGLKLFFDGNKNVIKDFSEKGRYGNKNFILNYYFDLNNYIDKNEKFKIIKNYTYFLKHFFGISLQEKNVFFIYKKMMYDLLNKKVFIKNNNITKSIIKGLNIDIKDIKNNLYYLYLIIEKYLQKNNNSDISYNCILEEMGLGISSLNKNKLKQYLTLLNYSYVEYTKKDGEVLDLYIVKLKLDKSVKITSTLIYNNKLLGYNHEVISVPFNFNFLCKGFQKDKNILLLFLYIIYQVKLNKGLKISIKSIKNILGEESITTRTITDKMKIISDLLLKKKIINYFLKKNTTFFLGKNKLFIENKK